MQDYYELHADALNYFKNEARKAFEPLCNSFGLQEENMILTDTDNLFQVRFSNSKIRIVVTGVNWGMNTDIRFGANTQNSNLYSILRLIKARKPEIPIAGNQIDQLFGYSHYLMTYASDILQGETSFFNEQEALLKKKEENDWKAMQAEITRKISEGYLKIDTPFEKLVWRKPRPLLSTYSSIKDKFPHSFDVVANEGPLPGPEQYDAVITNWNIELDEIVIKDKVICELSTDKACVEIVAPQTGRLVWLLEEGIALKFPTCIAILDPQVISE